MGHAIKRMAQRIHDLFRALAIALKQMQRHTLSTLGTNPREPAQGLLKVFNRRGYSPSIVRI
jgi:hypothetical protein